MQCAYMVDELTIRLSDHDISKLRTVGKVKENLFIGQDKFYHHSPYVVLELTDGIMIEARTIPKKPKDATQLKGYRIFLPRKAQITKVGKFEDTIDYLLEDRRNRYLCIARGEHGATLFRKLHIMHEKYL